MKITTKRYGTSLYNLFCDEREKTGFFLKKKRYLSENGKVCSNEKNKDDSSLLNMLCFIIFHYHPKLFRFFVIKHGKSLCLRFFHFGNEQISLFLIFAPMQGVPVVRT